MVFDNFTMDSFVLAVYSAVLALIEVWLILPGIADRMESIAMDERNKIYRVLYRHVIAISVLVVNIILVFILGDPYSNMMNLPIIILSIIWYGYVVFVEDRS